MQVKVKFLHCIIVKIKYMPKEKHVACFNFIRIFFFRYALIKQCTCIVKVLLIVSQGSTVPVAQW